MPRLNHGAASCFPEGARGSPWGKRTSYPNRGNGDGTGTDGMTDTKTTEEGPGPIPALTPRGEGVQFLAYGDSCSGVPGTPDTEAHLRMAAVLSRLDPAPELVVFPGDEIRGLTDDADDLRAQWRHWFDVEMARLDRERIPLWHATGNHTAWDEASEAVFAEIMAHLPRNGPPGQEGLSYHVRHGPLLLVFVHTLWSGLGGEDYVETDWLDATLAANADARWKIVVGHHPAWTVNGFVGPVARTLAHPRPFWDVLVRHGVFAYLCSHILAFDAQVREGVLQITTAGAGTVHRMPPRSSISTACRWYSTEAVCAPR